MTVLEAYQYVQNRLNRNSTNSGDNIPAYQFVEAFNSAQIQWAEDRAKLSETNIIRKDEIQQLIQTEDFPTISTGDTYSITLPDNYLHYIRSLSFAPCLLYNHLVPEGDINRLLVDEFWKPSLEWGETLCTLQNKTLKIYTDNFTVSTVKLVYYRKPVLINIGTGFTDINGTPTTNVDPEFQNSSLIEILNATCVILSGDTSDQWNYQTSSAQTQKHT